MILRPQEPRSVTVIRHVLDYLLTTNTTQEAYADDVRQAYHARVPDPKARCMQFHEGGDAAADLNANAQLVMRILNRAVRFPGDLEEAFVYALPEERRRLLIADLARRYEILPAPIPRSAATDKTADLCRLLHSTGETIKALGPIVSDGVVDERDRPHAKKALKTINQAISELVSWQALVTEILPDGQGGEG